MGEETHVKILEFLLNGERFGLKVSDILEVNRLPPIQPVHGADESVSGIINLHGKSAPLIALDKLLKLKYDSGVKELFIALKTQGGAICFLVDKLIGFEEISENDMQRLDNMALKFDAEYLSFVFFKSGFMISVLNVNFLTRISK